MPHLAHKSECTGCSACVSICPQKCLQMQEDKCGFLHPIMENLNLCVDCGLCGKVCPIQTGRKSLSDRTEAYAAYSEREEIRRDSSSGGLFTELALEILKNGGAVYGAAYDEYFSVRHICVETPLELARLRGAKYAQSDLGNSFIEIRGKLKAGQQVLFAGTPCQVAGLKSYLQRDYDGLFTVDFVCHGVPSPAAWESYVRYRSGRDHAGCLPEWINLRSKSTGWSRYQYSNVYQYSDGVTYSARSGSDLYMRLFVGDYINRESCGNCHFKGYDRVSDITLGDFWGIWDIAPEMDDNRGTSLVLLHSEKGKKLFDFISVRIRYRQVTLEQASAQNPSLLSASAAKPQRETVLKLAIAGEFEAAEKMLPVSQPPKVTFRARLAGRIRRIMKHESEKP